LQFHASGFVFHARDEPDRSGTFCKRFGKFPTAKKQWRGMSGIDVLEFPITAENTKKHGGVFAYFRMLAQEIIDVIKNSHRIGAMVMPESAPWSIVVSRAAPSPLPETSAIRKAVRSSLIGNTSK